MIHQVKTMKITSVKEVWIGIGFDDFTSPFTQFLFRLKDTSNTRDSVSSAIQTPRISSKTLR